MKGKSEFYRRPDQILIHKPENTKQTVLRAVKEASVETMKKHKIRLDVMTAAAMAVQNTLKSYVRPDPQHDELSDLTGLAEARMREVFKISGVTDDRAIETFAKSLADHLPPHPSDVARAPRKPAIRIVPPNEAPS